MFNTVELLIMINIFTWKPGPRSLFLWVVLVFMYPGLAIEASAEGKAIRYKKQTVVDFEDALIEGKSRKPYSAYLSKQKDEEMRGLFDWDLDWERRVRLSTDGAEHRK